MLSPDQAIAYDSIMVWWESHRAGLPTSPFFRLSGFAGTGKSFLTSYIMNNIDANNVAVCTFTWKAALVLQEKGVNASSIHSTFYKLVDDHHYEDTEARGKNKIKRHLGFDLKSPSEVLFDLIVIDEASMVPEEMRESILSYGIPILFVGDAGQLPPVADSTKNKKQFMEDAEAQLTQIHRQALESPIIRLSMDIRNNKYIPYGKYGDGTIICKFKDISDSLLLKSDQIICGKNITRKLINKRVRKAKGYDVDCSPYPNEKLIVTQNDHDLGLFNGMMLYATEDPISNSHHEFRLEESRINFIHYRKDSTFTEESNIIRQNKFFFDEITYFSELDGIDSELDRAKEKYKIIKREKLVQADFGYAVTCHKFQGSQAPKVVACFEMMKGATKEDVIRWKYTAVTRAESKLIFSQ